MRAAAQRRLSVGDKTPPTASRARLHSESGAIPTAPSAIDAVPAIQRVARDRPKAVGATGVAWVGAAGSVWVSAEQQQAVAGRVSRGGRQHAPRPRPVHSGRVWSAARKIRGRRRQNAAGGHPYAPRPTEGKARSFGSDRRAPAGCVAAGRKQSKSSGAIRRQQQPLAESEEKREAIPIEGGQMRINQIVRGPRRRNTWSIPTRGSGRPGQSSCSGSTE